MLLHYVHTVEGREFDGAGLSNSFEKGKDTHAIEWRALVRLPNDFHIPFSFEEWMRRWSRAFALALLR